MKITVNGKEIEVKKGEFGYDELVDFAYPRPLYTVVFSNGMPLYREGTVLPGSRLAVCDGMKIDIAHTGNA